MAIVRSLARLDDPARFATWAYRIVSRKAVDWIRGRQRQRKLDKTLIEDRRRQQEEAEVEAEHADDVSRLRSALATMPDDRRALLSMLYVDGLSVGEISRVLGVPAGTVKSRLFHARNHLRKVLEDDQ